MSQIIKEQFWIASDLLNCISSKVPHRPDSNTLILHHHQLQCSLSAFSPPISSLEAASSSDHLPKKYSFRPDAASVCLNKFLCCPLSVATGQCGGRREV